MSTPLSEVVSQIKSISQKRNKSLDLPTYCAYSIWFISGLTLFFAGTAKEGITLQLILLASTSVMFGLTWLVSREFGENKIASTGLLKSLYSYATVNGCSDWFTRVNVELQERNFADAKKIVAESILPTMTLMLCILGFNFVVVLC